MRAARFSTTTGAVLAALVLAGTRWAGAQGAPIIDSVHVDTRNIFDDAEAARSVLFRVMNVLHVTTQPYVVRRELLFHAGEPYDAARVAETERNLRALGIFRDVTIDTLRFDDKLIVRVATSDGWTTNLTLNASSTGGVFTWSAGLTEQNVFGTANMAGINYRNEVDRNALRIQGRINRAFGTRLVARGFYDDFSDGERGVWAVGVPFRALSDRVGADFWGEAARQRVLQYRTDALPDTTAYRRTAFVQAGSVAWAPVAGSGGFVRVGVLGHVRREEFVLQDDTLLLVPDSVSGTVGAFVEVLRPRFRVVTHYNGFAREEDVNLSTVVAVAGRVAPAAFGYARSGFAPAAVVQTGVGFGSFFARFGASAHGMFTSAGLDSGQVRASVTLASQLLRRQATVMHVEAGLQKNPVPGGEFDLGHGLGPRAFAPHAFTGTRTVWGILEHRAFLFDNVLGLLGVGVAAFLDYGGAWFGDQAARHGGNVGFGLRLGTTRSTGPNVGRFDLAYQFGDGVTGNRWVFSFGRSYEF